MKRNNKRACLFDIPIDITTMNEVKEKLLTSNRNMQVVTINPEMLTIAHKDKNIAEVIKESDMVIPDGIGVVLGLRMIGVKTERIPGIELAYELLKEANKMGLKVALIGATEETIQTAKLELLKELPNLNIVYTRNGFFEDCEADTIINDIVNAEPEIILAGLGFPKQEILLKSFKNILKRAIMIGVGGSFDVWSKKVKRAPEIFQKLNLEWFYRLLCQPSRFKRMFPTIPLFLIKVAFNSRINRKEY